MSLCLSTTPWRQYRGERTVHPFFASNWMLQSVNTTLYSLRIRLHALAKKWSAIIRPNYKNTKTGFMLQLYFRLEITNLHNLKYTQCKIYRMPEMYNLNFIKCYKYIVLCDKGILDIKFFGNNMYILQSDDRSVEEVIHY